MKKKLILLAMTTTMVHAAQNDVYMHSRQVDLGSSLGTTNNISLSGTVVRTLGNDAGAIKVCRSADKGFEEFYLRANDCAHAPAPFNTLDSLIVTGPERFCPSKSNDGKLRPYNYSVCPGTNDGRPAANAMSVDDIREEYREKETLLDWAGVRPMTNGEVTSNMLLCAREKMVAFKNHIRRNPIMSKWIEGKMIHFKFMQIDGQKPANEHHQYFKQNSFREDEYDLVFESGQKCDTLPLGELGELEAAVFQEDVLRSMTESIFDDVNDAKSVSHDRRNVDELGALAEYQQSSEEGPATMIIR